MRKISITISVLFVSILVLTGCSQEDESSHKQQIYKSIPESEAVEEVYHIEVIDSGFLVFYRSNNGLRAGIIDEKLKWITKSGDASLNPEKGMSVFFSNRKEENLYFSYGVISNPGIVEVISSNDNIEKEAKIIKTNEGVRLWFVFYDKPTESIWPDIIGISEDGQRLVNSNE